jgi:broad specificity phosphatase PhoE
VLVVTHRGFLMMAHRAATGHDRTAPIGNGSVSQLECDGAALAVLAWNVDLVPQGAAENERGVQGGQGAAGINYY